jgi:type IV secretory pathway VirB9-like protein
MHDLGLVPTSVVIELRNTERRADWAKNMKGAGAKAAKTRAENQAKAEARSRSAKKAHATRRRNANESKQ